MPEETPPAPTSTTVPATPPATTPTVTAPSTPAPPAAPSVVTIPLDQLQTFTTMQARLAAMEAEQKTRDDATKAELVAVLAKKGEVDNALALLRKQSDDAIAAERGQRAATEARAARYALDGEVSRVLASQPLVPGAAAQLTKLWRDQFNVTPAGDTFVVQTATLQSVEAFVAAQLALPEYAHFVRAQNPGGGTGGVTPATQTAPAGAPAPAEAPKTLSDAVILAMKNRTSAGDGRVNPGAAFGLRKASG